MAVRHRRLPNGAYEAVDNVEANLNASATPIAVEAEPRGKRDIRQEQIDRLIALGKDPEDAERMVDEDIARNGPMAPELFDHYNTPEKNEDLRRRIAGSRERLAQLAGFEANYNAETGHPEYGYDEAGNAARLGRVDISKPSEREKRDAGARRYQTRAPYNAEIEAANYGPGSDYVTADPAPPAGMTVPGPRTLDGKPVRAPQPLMTEDDVAAYDTRPEGGLSQRDRDMRERGFVPVVTPDGVRYMLQSSLTDGDMLAPVDAAGRARLPPPGGVGRRGTRPDLTQSSPQYPKGKYETRTEIGPDGREVDVLAPTAEFKTKQDDVARSRRQAASDRKAEARKAWQATAFLAGGSQNLNSGNRWIANALYKMAPEERDAAMRYMLPGGQLHAHVDAANASKAAEMAQRAMTAFLANNPGADPAARKQAEDLMLREKNPAMAGARDISAGNTESPEAQNELSRLAESHDTTAGGFSYEDERRFAATLQKPPYNMSQADAEATAYKYAEKRRWESGGGPAGSAAEEEAERTSGWAPSPSGLPVPAGTPRYQWR